MRCKGVDRETTTCSVAHGFVINFVFKKQKRILHAKARKNKKQALHHLYHNIQPYEKYLGS